MALDEWPIQTMILDHHYVCYNNFWDNNIEISLQNISMKDMAFKIHYRYGRSPTNCYAPHKVNFHIFKVLPVEF